MGVGGGLRIPFEGGIGKSPRGVLLQDGVPVDGHVVFAVRLPGGGSELRYQLILIQFDGTLQVQVVNEILRTFLNGEIHRQVIGLAFVAVHDFVGDGRVAKAVRLVQTGDRLFVAPQEGSAVAPAPEL